MAVVQSHGSRELHDARVATEGLRDQVVLPLCSKKMQCSQ